MRKYLIGILIGAALMFSASAFAADIKSLIGTKVQGEFPVKINGETLEKHAIVIDGTSYLPNRAIANALNMDISFNADLGIELKKKEVTPVSTGAPISTPSVTEQTYDVDTINVHISVDNNYIKLLTINIQESPSSPNVEEWKAQLNKYQDDLAIWEARKAALPK